MGRIFAVGDIHGCLDKLTALMETVEIDWQTDTLVFVGDYVDRGPDSKEVVDYLADLRRRTDRVVFLKGNHEYLLGRYLQGKDVGIFLANGGEATVRSYERHGGTGSHLVPPDHMAFFQDLLPFYETVDYLFVHGGFKPHVPIKEQSEWDMLWIRDAFIYSDYDFGKPVIFGHTPFKKPLVMDNKIGIDTGAVYGNRLTCVELPGMRFFSV